VYCTGGARSAFVVAALRSLGLGQARNYDGFFWEWAADASLAVEPAPAKPR
jgi:3-mercaptopyruvate sulfurtransferase SseA